MKWLLRCLVIVACAAGPALAQDEFSQAGNRFGWDLYQHLRSRPGNLVVSPFSINTALLMLDAGAAGPTAEQMQATLQIPSMQPVALAAAAGKAMRSLETGPGNQYELRIANAVWIRQGFVLLPSYLDLLHNDFTADAKPANFADPEGAAKQINDWVGQQTENRITNLISPGQIPSDARLALVNAVYFKGSWTSPFEAELTHQAPWHLPDGSVAPKSANMMHQHGEFEFFEDDHLAALQMPYAGDRLGMLAILPAGNLDELEKSLNADELDRLVGRLNLRSVNVAFPKFTLRNHLELNQPLTDMGMTDAFTNAADFSGMDGRRDLAVSSVMQAGFVQVDETGTEAAAASGGIMRPTAVMVSSTFNADHPFLFIIRDLKTGTILFMSRVDDPTD